MSDAECNDHIHNKELLAILQAFQEWKQYTNGTLNSVRILNNKRNFVTSLTAKELSQPGARSMQELSQYYLKIEYQPGKAGDKRGAHTRSAGDLATAGDKRLRRNIGT